MVRTVDVFHVGQLVDAIDEIKVNHRPGLPLWFRGQGNADWGVEPALWRHRPDGRFTMADERNFTHRFRTRAAIRYPSTPGYEDHPAWLSLMQHYGLPTRLLDWSRSPLVAAYFAVQAYVHDDETEVLDAAVWVLSPHDLNIVHAGMEVTPALSSQDCEPLVSMAFRNPSRTPRGRRNAMVMAAMATELDLRMFVQQGCFTVHAAEVDSLESDPQAESYLWRLRIPRSSVKSVAAQMETLGFRRGDLFPDLQHLAEELVDSYPPGSVWATKR